MNYWILLKSMNYCILLEEPYNHAPTLSFSNHHKLFSRDLSLEKDQGHTSSTKFNVSELIFIFLWGCYTVSSRMYWTSVSMTLFFFMSYFSHSLSWTPSSFSIDMGKLSFNLKSSYDHCWQTHNTMGDIFAFFLFTEDPLSGIKSHNLENWH